MDNLSTGNLYDADKSVEPDMKKARLPKNRTESKNRNRRNTQRDTSKMSEVECLRSELSSVHGAYANEINKLKDNFKLMSTTFDETVEFQANQIANLENDLEVTEEELTILQNSEKDWIGRTLKLKFILDEIKKIGALPEDHAEWVYPMIEDTEIPEVPINVKDMFVPTTQTDNIDWTDEGEDSDNEEDSF
jgi:hypothetical protein